MQGQRGVIGSFAETLDFDHGTTPNNATVDQQSYWNHVLNTAENQMPDYMLSPSEMNIAIMDSSSYERPNLSRWCLGEPSSSNIQNEVSCDERKAEFGWSSSISPFAMSGPRFEEGPYEPISNFSLDNNMSPMFTQGSNSDAVQQSLNLTAGFVGLSSNTSQTVEYPNTYRSIGSENEHIQPASGSDSFLLPEENTGLPVGENDGRPGSLEGRLSCKRKAIEGNAGQSSIGGSSSYLQHTERPGVSARYNAGCSLGLSASSAEANPRHGIGVREVTSNGLTDSSIAGSSERTHRNLRLRINNPSNQQNSIPPPICPSVRTVRHASVSSSQMPPHPVNHTLDLRPASMVDNMNFQSQPGSIHAPNLQQNVRPLRWSGGSTSRAGSSTSGIYADRDGPLREEIGRSMARRMLDHPIFLRAATDLRNFARHPPTRSLNGGSITAAGTVASTSQTGSGPDVHPSTGPTWLPHHNQPPQYPRRLSEFVRRSLVSSSRTDSGALNSSHLPIRGGQPSSSEEMVLSEAGNQGHLQHQPRSASWLERHNEGIHHRLRSLAATSEGSDRLVSEIRNVFDLMRRGESLRVEDVMILDQSAFMGVADMHDRHRDMRLDVDNMSYEELLALEERIGNVSTGLSEETILNRLKLKKCLVLIGSQFEAEPCCICQEQYNEGEDLGSLECGHDFHTGCIKQWLMHKNLCPICKTTGLTT